MPGPVREQPTRVLSEKPCSRLTPPRPSGRPFAATRSRLTLQAVSGDARLVGDWFQDGRLKSQDWPTIRGRACVLRDDDQSPAYASHQGE